LAFEIRPPRPTAVRVLLPAPWREPIVELDGHVVEARLETVGTDRYARVETDGRGHRVRVRPARVAQAAPASRP
jgi:hypothetical protein